MYTYASYKRVYIVRRFNGYKTSLLIIYKIIRQHYYIINKFDVRNKKNNHCYRSH